MPTREAYAVAILALLIFVVALNLQAGWVYAVDALLAGVLIVGFFSARYTVRGVSVARMLPSEAVEGEPVGVRLTFGATGVWPRCFVEALDAVPGLRPMECFLPALDPRRGSQAFYLTTAVRRGIHRAGATRIRSGGLTGLFVASRRLATPVEITIYPRFWRIATLTAAVWTPAAQTAGSTRRRGGLEFYGLRDYRHGDSVRHVHWRSSARRGALMVREFEQEIPGSVSLLVDTRPDAQRGIPLENTFEDLIRAAASIAWYVTARGGSVRLLASGVTGVLDLTGGWRTIMRALAGLAPEGTLSPEAVISRVALDRKASLVVLTPDPTAISGLAADHPGVAGVLADRDSYAPSAGGTGVHDLGRRGAEWDRPGRGVPLCVIRRGDDIGARLAGDTGDDSR